MNDTDFEQAWRDDVEPLEENAAEAARAKALQARADEFTAAYLDLDAPVVDDAAVQATEGVAK